MTARAGRCPATFTALGDLAERCAIPVVEFWPQQTSLPTTHPLHGGFDVEPWLANADAILVVDAPVPWIPSRHAPPPDCPVIQIGPDPLFASLPMRSFPATFAIAADTGATLEALGRAFKDATGDNERSIDERRHRVGARCAELRAARLDRARAGQGPPMSAAWISHCLDRAKGDDAIVVNELGCDPAVMTFARRDGCFGHSLAGGLGWGLPAALGIQLADRQRLVIATVGDGSYQFANPVACHQAAEALDLPVLTVVFNNGGWDAVRKSTRAVYPDGHAARADRMPLCSLEPSPDYEKIAQASRGYGERVDDPLDLPAALQRALHAVKSERRQALLNVICG